MISNFYIDTNFTNYSDKCPKSFIKISPTLLSVYAWNIHNELGKGFSKAVYSDALEIELESNGVPFQKEVKFDIVYKGKKLKHPYYADYLVDGKIISEL